MRVLFSIVLPGLFLLEAIILYLSADVGYSEEFVRIVYISAILVLVQQLIRSSVYKQGGWIQLDIFFLAMFFFVHFWGWLTIDIGQINDLWTLKRYLGSVNEAVAIAFLGMVAFVFAYNLPKEAVRKQKITESNPKSWQRVGTVMFFAGFITWAVYWVMFGQDVLKGTYVGSDVGGLGATSLYHLHGIFTKLGIALIMVSAPRRSWWSPSVLLPFGLMVMIMLSYLVQGDRSEFLFTIVVFLFAYHRYVKPISMKISIAGFVGFALLMSAVQIARRSDDRSLAGIYDAFVNPKEEVSVEASLQNIGNSGFVYLAAVDLVPEKFDYFWGQLKVYELAGILPYLRRLIFTEGVDYATTSQFLTLQIIGKSKTTGTGTTIIADLYIDFGPLGVAFGMALLGFVGRLVSDRATERSNIIWTVLFCYFAGLLTTLPRYSFLKIIRGLVWPLMILWLSNKLFVRSQRPVEESRNEVTQHGITILSRKK